MKRTAALLAALLLLLTGSACSEKQQETGMTIKPSEFSAETNEILELLDEKIQFFDLSLDESVKSRTITVWAVGDDGWTEVGKIEGNVNARKERIAIRLTESGYDVYRMDEKGYEKYSRPEFGTDFEGCSLVGGVKLHGETPIELGREIPLLYQLGTNENSMERLDITEDPRNLDCSAGLAFFITVSEEAIH